MNIIFPITFFASTTAIALLYFDSLVSVEARDIILKNAVQCLPQSSNICIEKLHTMHLLRAVLADTNGIASLSMEDWRSRSSSKITLPPVLFRMTMVRHARHVVYAPIFAMTDHLMDDANPSIPPCIPSILVQVMAI